MNLHRQQAGGEMKKVSCETFLLRRLGSNQRPSGYEPDELPLLYFAMWGANIGAAFFQTKTNFNELHLPPKF
jgi:hypothetical protein